MQVIGQLNVALGADSFATGIAARGGVVILHNLSPYELQLIFNHDPERSALLFAWQQRKFDFCNKQTDSISYSILTPLSSQINPPSTIIIGEAYAPGEPVPESLPNYDRLSNVGNQTLPTASTPALVNDGNNPGAEIIEATPSDQTESSWDFNNDGSGFLQVLSSGILRNVINIIRGNLVTDAQVTIGDPADVTMLTVHGTCDNASQAGQATSALTAIASLQIQMFDGGLGTVRQVNMYEGPIDPSTYITPNEGDFWFDG